MRKSFYTIRLLAVVNYLFCRDSLWQNSSAIALLRGKLLRKDWNSLVKQFVIGKFINRYILDRIKNSQSLSKHPGLGKICNWSPLFFHLAEFHNSGKCHLSLPLIIWSVDALFSIAVTD